MKRHAFFAAVFLFAAGLTQAEVQPAAKSTDASPVPAKAADTKALAKTGTKQDDKKKVEEPKIPGVTIARPNGTFLGLEVVGGQFKLSFYDKKKKAMPVDVTRATARWPNTKSATVAFNRTVLNPAGGTALLGSKPALPPYAWNVFITLLQGDGDDAKAVETYTVPFHN